MSQIPPIKVIFYELNEVPWQVIDYFMEETPNSTFAEILRHAHQYTTETHDSGELHPWSTWPTVHRGVYNDTHNIRFLNQDIKNTYPPIWELLTKSKKSVGLFGSLQSWPVPKQKKQYKFYIPDTFAPSPETYPESLEAFQRVNLLQTKKDGGQTPARIKISWDSIKDFLSFFDQGFSIKTALMLAGHLINEQLNPLYKNLRPVMQAPVTFDFYYHLLQETHPDFSSYFTNHVAGMMHRYWKYTFPEEFNYEGTTDEDQFKSRNIIRALKIADQQLKKLKQFADAQGYTLMIASSMGQEAVERGEYKGELRITDFDHFYKGIGYEGPVKNNLAMQPDFAFSFKTKQDCEHFSQLIKAITTPDNEPLFTLKQAGNTLNCNLKGTTLTLEKQFIYKDALPLGLDQLGISLIERDPGTGYHQPKGVWIVYKKGLTPVSYREKIESIQIAPTLLDLWDIKIPSYMKKPLSLKEAILQTSSPQAEPELDFESAH
ncbi:MAG: hypothetical protein ACK5PQ_04070 [Alphaproteobacteria bacterium]